jgi:hypothetical protein
MMVGLSPKPSDAVAPRSMPIPSARTGRIKLALPGILLLIACLTPYLTKAFTIDDPWFLLEARQILKTPSQPMSFDVCWMGNETCTRAALLGPGALQALMGYLLTPVILANGAEWVAHCIQLLLACICVVSMVRVTLRLGFNQIQAVTAGLLLVAIPPFLAMTATAMPDIAALALALTGIEQLLAWKNDRRWRQAVAAATLLGLAPYARPQTVFLIPLAALWLFDDLPIAKAVRQFRRQLSLWAPIPIALCILAGVIHITRDRGSAAAGDTLLRAQNIPPNLAAYAMYLAFPIPFALIWLGVHWRKTPGKLVLPAIPMLVMHFVFFRSQDLLDEWPTLAALYGLTAVGHLIYTRLRSGDRLGLILSLCILIPVPAALFAHLPIKYLLAVMPAVILLMVRALWRLESRPALQISGTLLFSLTLYSCLLLEADADFAEYGRRAAAELIAPHVAAGERVWYGGEWGFYWYAAEAGAKISKPGEPGPNPGDLLAVGLVEGGDVTRDRFPHRVLVDSRSYDAPHGRTMGYGGGLYSNGCGKSLWVWKPETTNDYELWRVY